MLACTAFWEKVTNCRADLAVTLLPLQKEQLLMLLLVVANVS